MSSTYPSLVIAEQIELLGDPATRASTNPQCLGAEFKLQPGYDMGAPQPVTDTVISAMLDGEIVSGRRASNRTIRMPVHIHAPDWQTLAGARELLFSLIDRPTWTMTWTRAGADYPVVFDCFRAHATTVQGGGVDETLANPVDLVTIEFDAQPYGRSDVAERIAVASPISGESPPPNPIVLDDFSTVSGTNWDQVAGHYGSAYAARWTPPDWGAKPYKPQMYCTYSATLATHQDLRGLTSMQVWLGLGWDTAHSNYWRGFTGRIVLGWTLTDGGNRTLSFSRHDYLPFSPTADSPRWNKVTTPIPAQNPAGDFDFSDVASWSLNLENWRGVFLYFTPRLDAVTAMPPSVKTAPSARGDVYTLLGVKGAARTPLSLAFQQAAEPGSTTVTLPDTAGEWALWTCPAGVATVKAENVGGSGAGSRRTTTGYGGGGKGGEYAREDTAKVTPGGQYWYKTGKAGSAGTVPTVSTPYFVGAARLAYESWYLDVPVTNPTSAGETISVGINVQNPLQVGNVYDSAGNTYKQVIVDGYNVPRLAHFRALPADQWGGNTAALTISDYVRVEMTDWGGGEAIVAAGAGLISVDRTAKAHADTGSPSVTTGTLNQAYELAIATLSHGNAGGTPTWGSGFTGLYTQHAGSDNYLSVAYKKTSTTSAVTATASITSTAWTISVATFRAETTGGGDVTDGTDSVFIADDVTITAHGGLSVPANTATGATTMTGTSTNTVHYAGGSGATGTASGGGGGGGSGGESSAGNPGAVTAGGAAVTGGGAGGAGGTSGGNNAGTAGSVPGGAGGGGFSTGGTAAGGGGAAGRVKLTYSSSAGPAFSTLIAHIPGPDAPASLCPLVPVPTGDTPNGGTEYWVESLLEAENAVFKATYSVVLVSYSWNTPANARTVTVTVKQHETASGPVYSTSVARTFTPSSDITNGIVVLGEITLPGRAMARDNTAAYFGLTVTDTNTSDRFMDVLFLDTQGATVMVNNPAASAWRNIYLDEPAPDYSLGRITSSAYDRAQAISALDYCPAVSGPPMLAYPGDNILLAYCVEGAPQIGVSYFPRWFMDRLP